MRKLAAVLVFIALLLAAYYGQGAMGPESPAGRSVARPSLDLPAPASRPGFVRVLRVVDGDTLVLPGNERLRLIGINTDEVPRDRVDTASAGWRAALYTRDLLAPDAQVRLEFDQERTDKYGRTLAYAWLPDGRMLNAEIMRAGWARVMRIAPNTRYATEFARLERAAREANLGRWQAP